MKKVLLLSVPMGALERPALGLSLLKARLAETGVACDLHYLTFAFAELIGADEYQWLAYELPYTACAGDWVFTHTLYGAQPAREQAYVNEVLRGTWQLDEQAVARLLRVRALTPHFIEHCLAALPWQDYDLVGFTSTFEQNLASLALAQRLKAKYPHLVIVFGGANWEGEMGVELHRQFRCVDYVCSGEAERSFPELVRRVFNGERVAEPLLRGIVYRRGDESVFTGPPEPLRDLDALPLPDYSDYFQALEQSQAGNAVVPTLLFETSRGCWWGAVSHCTFCGLNGGAMAYRSKSPPRALAELETLLARWGVEMVEVVDNILDMKYFREVLPELARRHHPAQLFYEVKANLSRAQVALLRQAGVLRIQPGIESLHDHVLQLMRKGTTALQNIQLLKWCRQYGVTAEWNILYGFPGETRQDYAEMLELLKSLHGLRPPSACGPIRLDRFSPYHSDPAAFGLTNVRPINSCQYLYPFAPESLRRIAYYFDFDYEPGADPRGVAAEVIAYVTAWQREGATGSLLAVPCHDGALLLIDTRFNTPRRQFKLRGLERAAYEYCDEAHTSANVTAHLQAQFPDLGVREAGVVRFLDALVARRLMVHHGSRYLSLAVASGAETARAADVTAHHHQEII